MFKNIIFYFVGGLFSIIFIAYGVFLITNLISDTNKAYRSDLLKAPEITSFNLERFKELEVNQEK